MYGKVSDTEISYTRRGCESDVRRDGRGIKDYRRLQMENNPFPHVNGSSHVHLADSMDVVCSVKVDVIEALPDFPDKGVVMFSADISPSCGLKVDDKRRAEEGARVAEKIQSVLLGANAIDLESLCIISGNFCWLVHIDLVINHLDGDPLDVCAIAAYIALLSSRIPKIDTVIGESGRPDDFQVCGDLSAAVPLKVKDIPLCITVVKIGNVLVMDANSVEHASADYAFTVAIDRNGDLCGLFKLHGSGSVAVPDLSKILENASCMAASIFKQLSGSKAASAMNVQASHPDGLPQRAGLLWN